LKKELFHDDLRHINTQSDSEIILNVFAHELHKLNKLKPEVTDLFKAVEGVHKRCRGAYAVVAMITGVGVIAFRDPFGIRPLIFGKKETNNGFEAMVASESVALTSQNFEVVDDVMPG